MSGTEGLEYCHQETPSQWNMSGKEFGSTGTKTFTIWEFFPLHLNIMHGFQRDKYDVLHS